MVLEWFRSYLGERSFSVYNGNPRSSTIQLRCSAPQGSVLGPVLFVLYTADLADIARSNEVMLHAYADDTQAYLHFSLSSITAAVSTLEECLDAVEQWLASNRLKLNADKTELL